MPRPAGAVRGQQQLPRVADRVVGRDRLLWKNVDGGAEFAGFGQLGQGGEVDDLGAAGEDDAGVVADFREVGGAEKAFVLGGDTGHEEQEFRGGQGLVEGDGAATLLGEPAGRQPGVVDQDLAAEGGEQRTQGSAEIAVADQADGGTVEADRVGVATDAVALGSCAELRVGTGDAAAEVDGGTKAPFGDGLGHGGGDGEDMDAVSLAGGVVERRLPVALDVDHGAQLRSTRDVGSVEVGLADDDRGLGQMPLDHFARHAAALEPGLDAGDAVELGPGVFGQDHRPVPRVRVDEDQRRLGHLMPVVAMPVVM